MSAVAQEHVSSPQVFRASKNIRADTLTIFAVGFLVTFISTSTFEVALTDLLNGGSSASGGLEPLAIAQSLANSGQFADPFGAPTGPTAHMGPVFPLYLAGILVAVKAAAARAMLLHLGATLFHALELALLPLLSAAIFGEIEIGFYAGLLGIFIPCYNVLPLWDSSFAGLATIGFCFAATRVEARSRLGMSGLGALWGAILLLNPALAIPSGIWALFTARKRLWSMRKIGLALFAAVLICLPWTIRNYSVLGGLIPIRDNFGLELQVSNNPYAAPGIRQNAESMERFHPSLNGQQSQAVRQRGERLYQQDKLRQAAVWIEKNPQRFVVLSMQRVREFWFPPAAGQSFINLGIWLVTLLSMPGIVLVFRRQAPYGIALVWMLALAPLPYYVVQSDPRYRTPFLWISLLLAGYAVHSIMAMHSSRRSNALRPEKPRELDRLRTTTVQ